MQATALLFCLGAQTAAPPVTVTGCLTATTVNGEEQFTLTTRDTNRATADVKTETYQLTPSANIDLKSLVNRRVEITGTDAMVATDATTVDSTREAESRPARSDGRPPSKPRPAPTSSSIT